MSTVARLLDRLWKTLEGRERERRERWLGKATDVYDLERRIRELERSSARSWGAVFRQLRLAVISLSRLRRQVLFRSG